MAKEKPKIQKTIAIGCVFNAKGEVLLALRFEPQIPDAHEVWEFPGGHIDYGETPAQAVIREIFEETGIIAEVDTFLPVVFTAMWEHRDYSLHTLILAYGCHAVGGKLQIKDKKVTELKWVMPEEVLKHRLHTNIAETLELALKN